MSDVHRAPADIEGACRLASLRYLTLADEETDPVRRLGLLDLAGGALSAARDHAVSAAGMKLAERPDPAPQQRRAAEVTARP